MNELNSEENSPQSKRHGPASDQRGSALVMAIFVMVLLTGLGTALLFLGENEIAMSQASVRTKVAFFLAEAAIEDGRTRLWDVNRNGTFDDDLSGAAGADGLIDILDPEAISPVYDTDGLVTGFTGFNDDVPLVASNRFGDGVYGAFLSNDPVDGRTNLTDSNDRVLIAGIGVDEDGAVEIVEAIVLLRDFLPSVPPATITLLGPSPGFASGNSKVKDYIGVDCDGGPGAIPGLYVPVVGTIGSDAVLAAEAGMEGNPDFESGDPVFADELDAFADLTDAGEPSLGVTGTIDPDWTECENLREMVILMRETADTVCPDGSDLGSCVGVPASSPTRIVFADGDFSVGPTNEAGTLVVTGALTFNGRTTWEGLILAIGEGRYAVVGAGNGSVLGGIIVADIAGPDNIFGNADDCTGGDNGFDQVIYDERGGGNANTTYCTATLAAVNPVRPYEVIDFLQH